MPYVSKDIDFKFLENVVCETKKPKKKEIGKEAKDEPPETPEKSKKKKNVHERIYEMLEADKPKFIGKGRIKAWEEYKIRETKGLLDLLSSECIESPPLPSTSDLHTLTESSHKIGRAHV